MRGADERSGQLFSYVDLEARVRADDPLRVISAIANEALAMLAPDFSAFYSRIGRPSVAPERRLARPFVPLVRGVGIEARIWTRKNCPSQL